MKVLFIGGTGLISSACTALAVERGIDLHILNRGSDPDRAGGATTIAADIHDEPAAERALAGHRFDAVVDWIAFTPEDVERDLRLFSGKTGQFVFISSASAYQKPPVDWIVREDTPLANPFWDYSRNKIACEERLMHAYREDGFPVTIVRPSLTYGDTNATLVGNSWERPYTAIARMRAGSKVIVPGDGTSLWTITHNTDFAVGSSACSAGRTPSATPSRSPVTRSSRGTRSIARPPRPRTWRQGSSTSRRTSSRPASRTSSAP